MSTPTGQREGRSQADRSRETRRKLMQATVECLVERGWAGTTTTVVAERAGVSRGAQLHHFRTRGELVAAAVEHLGAESVLDLKERARQVNGSTVAVVELIADFYASDLFTAALELWVAARTDPELKTVVVPLEVRLGRETHRLAVELLNADETKPGVRETVQLTLDLVRGLALANQLTDDGKRRSRIIRHWARMLEDSL
ncbi:TetR/AcrR family transcriptional regulator [Saccharothrix saharensis]|uniref:TetR/AcrR family transcriptional regulator n=1 Tax=Saccharothrix saharensis TaxID=571190 RepID=UPI0036AD523A